MMSLLCEGIFPLDRKDVKPGELRYKLLPRVLENSARRPPMKLCLCVSIVILLALPLFAQQSVPEISFDSVPDFFKLPSGMNFGEVPGVAVDSKGNIYVFTRSNTA